jgi:hypothetical protein
MVVWLVVLGLASPHVAIAQQVAKDDAENLVPPGGAAFDIPVHAHQVCVLSFPANVKSSALASTSDFTIKNWGNDGVAVLASGDKASTTLAVATETGDIKVNVTLHVVGPDAKAMTLVRFKAATAEEAFQARVEEEVSRRVEPFRAELERTQHDIDVRVRERADSMVAERLLKRHDLLAVQSHERNDDNVIVHVQQVMLIGDDGYLFFEVENHGKAAFRLARATVSARGTLISGPARIFSAAIDKDRTVLGLVPAGSTAHGVVVVRNTDQVRGVPLELELADPTGRGAIRLDRGIVVK